MSSSLIHDNMSGIDGCVDACPYVKAWKWDVPKWAIETPGLCSVLGGQLDIATFSKFHQGLEHERHCPEHQGLNLSIIC